MNWARHSARWLRENLGPALLALLAAACIVQASALALVALYRDHGWRLEAAAARARVAQLEREVADLAERARRATVDEAYLEALARRQGFVRPGERVVVPLPPNEGGR